MRGKLGAGLLSGAAAGAAGTTVLNAVTYLDMVWRARPASGAPQLSAERLARQTGLTVPGEGQERDNRLAGLGPLLGLATGVGLGAVSGAVLGVTRRVVPPALLSAMLGGAAMAGSDVPMALLGVTDPSSWTPAGWAADIVPHLAYGAVTAAVLSALLGRRPSRLS